MPRSSSNSKRPVKIDPVEVQTKPSISPIQTQKVNLFDSIKHGFGFGVGSSIAHNIFDSKPQSTVKPSTLQIDIKKREFKQCMEKTDNNYDECIHYLE
jgi:hypothetical protein